MTQSCKREQDPRWIRLSEKYLQHLLEECGLIKEEMDRHDLDSIRPKAHRIKGTAGTYRLGNIATAAADLENLAKGGEEEAARQALEAMIRAVYSKLQELHPGTIPPNTARGSCE